MNRPNLDLFDYLKFIPFCNSFFVMRIRKRIRQIKCEIECREIECQEEEYPEIECPEIDSPEEECREIECREIECRAIIAENSRIFETETELARIRAKHHKTIAFFITIVICVIWCGNQFIKFSSYINSRRFQY